MGQIVGGELALLDLRSNYIAMLTIALVWTDGVSARHASPIVYGRVQSGV